MLTLRSIDQSNKAKTPTNAPAMPATGPAVCMAALAFDEVVATAFVAVAPRELALPSPPLGDSVEESTAVTLPDISSIGAVLSELPLRLARTSTMVDFAAHTRWLTVTCETTVYIFAQ